MYINAEIDSEKLHLYEDTKLFNLGLHKIRKLCEKQIKHREPVGPYDTYYDTDTYFLDHQFKFNLCEKCCQSLIDMKLKHDEITHPLVRDIFHFKQENPNLHEITLPKLVDYRESFSKNDYKIYHAIKIRNNIKVGNYTVDNTFDKETEYKLCTVKFKDQLLATFFDTLSSDGNYKLTKLVISHRVKGSQLGTVFKHLLHYKNVYFHEYFYWITTEKETINIKNPEFTKITITFDGEIPNVEINVMNELILDKKLKAKEKKENTPNIKNMTTDSGDKKSSGYKDAEFLNFIQYKLNLNNKSIYIEIEGQLYKFIRAIAVDDGQNRPNSDSMNIKLLYISDKTTHSTYISSFFLFYSYKLNLSKSLKILDSDGEPLTLSVI